MNEKVWVVLGLMWRLTLQPWQGASSGLVHDGKNMAVRRPLDQKVLAVLKEAMVEDRLDVAEHLLQALEALQGEPRPGSSLGDAYLLIARPRRGRRHPRQAS
ncbi:hypothetical protein [Microvirga arsenatis]|uniref:Uncharacterized protein n=1 Tax=Microvirga arsenatis TaxID=2692265 RepID=A0ABW9YUA7_9HYPH|nr:hypothetical protein [Microvirga arsenatis]NBJ09437.1 hypothetical protein [Microvirga arsenatis]NBJ23705.1 hypothetical protein [Microvirga arsenatis]